MKTYHLKVEGMLEYRRYTQRRIVRTVLLVLIVLGVAAAIGLPTLDLSEDRSWLLFVPLVPLILGAFVLKLRESARRKQEAWSAFSISFGPHLVILRQLNMPETVVRRREVIGIDEVLDGLVVRTEDKFLSMNVPQMLEGYDELKEALAGWAPLRRVPRFIQVMKNILQYAIWLLIIVSFGMVFFMPSPWLALLATVPFLGLLGHGYWSARQYESYGAIRARRNNIVFLGLMLFFLFGRLILFYS